MKIYPAIDIKEGKCVRLRQGAANDATIYYEDPLDAAKLFLDAGSDRIHVVDLDGAFKGNFWAIWSKARKKRIKVPFRIA